MARSITMVESIGACKSYKLRISTPFNLFSWFISSSFLFSFSDQVRNSSYHHPRQGYHAHTALFARCLRSMARPIMLLHLGGWDKFLVKLNPVLFSQSSLKTSLMNPQNELNRPASLVRTQKKEQEKIRVHSFLTNSQKGQVLHGSACLTLHPIPTATYPLINSLIATILLRT